MLRPRTSLTVKLSSVNWKIISRYTRIRVVTVFTSGWGFPGGSEVKASAYNAGDPYSIPGLGRSPGEGNGNPLQYSCLDNPMDRGAWWAIVRGVAKSQTWLSNQAQNRSISYNGSVVKNTPANAEDAGSIPGSGRSPGEGNGNPLQYSCLENSMDRGDWWATVCRLAKSRTWLSNWTHTQHKWSYYYHHPFPSKLVRDPSAGGFQSSRLCSWCLITVSVRSLYWKFPGIWRRAQG